MSAITVPEWKTTFAEETRRRADFVGADQFLTYFDWRTVNRIAKVVAPRLASNGDGMITIVGRIDESGSALSPDGNYPATMAAFSKKSYGPKVEPPLFDAKFLANLSAPYAKDGPLVNIWEQSITNLKTMVSGACEGTLGLHFFRMDDSDVVGLRFSQKMFSLRKGPVDEISGKDETLNWPMQPRFKDRIKAMYRSSKIVPLIVWDATQPGAPKRVAAEDVQRSLLGALVEVTFTLHRYNFGNRNDGRNAQDDSNTSNDANPFTVTGSLKQIIIREFAKDEDDEDPFRDSGLTGPFVPDQIHGCKAPIKNTGNGNDPVISGPATGNGEDKEKKRPQDEDDGVEAPPAKRGRTTDANKKK